MNEQSDFPMTGVITKSDGLAVGRAQPALRAQNQELFAPHLGGIPTHAGILRQAEQIATGTIFQHFLSERQAAGRAVGVSLDLVDVRRGIKHVVVCAHRSLQNSGCQETRRKQFNKLLSTTDDTDKHGFI